MSEIKPNRLLKSLSSSARDVLLQYATAELLPIRTSLFRPDEMPSHVYFLTSGMASIVSSTEDGGTAEVGIVGSEGMVGDLHMMGPAKVHMDSYMQIGGTGLKVPFQIARRAFRELEEVRDRVLEAHQSHSLMVTQLVACNRLHEAEERLARWLLMAGDRTGSDELSLTQEFLGMMLGSRRTTVTLIAGTLQRAGFITYSRGRVKILNRAELEEAACDCYPIAKSLLTNLYAKV
jgi:CRP-like cAMP-binding protein